mmetsp:Transcript_96756/g.167964  ORF Transcript_96756/g.167964 Transcript_96756/m.167964 type:complete len:558 (+) Transcript_96756:131-1804(+)
MDPYKVLGVSANKIKHKSDLEPARRRAKQLYKRYGNEKNKFEAKKVLEAFKMIENNLKNKPGEGQYKIIGRSRKERELDKHFNHQTKEIKGNKQLKKVLKKEMKGGHQGLRLRGDKERVARPRRRKRRRTQQPKKQYLDALQGLNKVAGFLMDGAKFPKAIKLLNRWVREYMNQDNRGHVFRVMHKLTTADFIIDDTDARQEVVQVYEYVLGYFSAWFEEEESRQMLSWAWRVSTAISCQCFTDDAFMLSNTIGKLNEAMTLLERHKDVVAENGKSDDEEEPMFGNLGMRTPERSPYGMPTPEPSPSPDSEDEAVKPELKEEVKEEFEFEAKEEDEEDEKKDVKLGVANVKVMKAKEEVKEEAIDLDEAIELGDSDVEMKNEVIDSEDEVNSIDSANDVLLESLSSGDSDIDELSSGMSSEVEYCPDAEFKVPSTAASLAAIRKHFVFRCMGTLFSRRGPLWARSKIDTFFQDIFYRRAIFEPGQVTQVEAWQARIKAMQKDGIRDVGDANSNPLESHRPVIDSRETRTVLDADSNAWAAKQTFDARDKLGGRNVIR